MDLKELLTVNRSYRRFAEGVTITRETLEELVDLTRLTPSAANKQPLKFVLSCDEDRNARIFAHLMWAGYLPEWLGPATDERPSAYIVICADTEIDAHLKWGDHTVAAFTILMGAAERGLGGCMVGAFQKQNLRRDIKLPERYEPMLVVALGEPIEQVVLEELGEEGSIKYWRDEDLKHHVPKRSLKDILLEI
jgi:nitroreductase